MKKIYTLLAIACASFLMVFAMPSESYAANDCYDGGGHFYTYGSGPYTSFASLGGSTYGVNWACEGGNGYAVLFMLGSSPWSDGTNYYFPADSYVDLGNSTYPMVLFGLVHVYWGGGDHYAASIGLCLTSSCSEGDNGNGVFSYSGTRVLRATSNADSSLSNWSAPITGGGLSVTINGPLLAQWIRDNPGATSQYAGNICSWWSTNPDCTTPRMLFVSISKVMAIITISESFRTVHADIHIVAFTILAPNFIFIVNSYAFGRRSVSRTIRIGDTTDFCRNRSIKCR